MTTHATTEARLSEILRELRRQMNGAVSQTMRELGQRDVINFGVSLPTIKDIALRYAPNHELACQLSERQSREATIAALYIANAEQLTIDQMEKWSDKWRTEEIARLSAMLLFWKSPQAAEFASLWIGTTTALRSTSALYIVGRICGMVDDALILRAIEQSIKTPDAAGIFCMREIFFARPEFRDLIQQASTEIEELRWQIEV